MTEFFGATMASGCACARSHKGCGQGEDDTTHQRLPCSRSVASTPSTFASTPPPFLPAPPRHRWSQQGITTSQHLHCLLTATCALRLLWLPFHFTGLVQRVLPDLMEKLPIAYCRVDKVQDGLDDMLVRARVCVCVCL